MIAASTFLPTAPTVRSRRLQAAVNKAIYRMSINVSDASVFLNQAGTFTDLDIAGTALGAIFGATGGLGSCAFTRAEKPLYYEIASKGVERGYPAGWDNIHQWANDQGLKNLPPTPGMPHGAHQHWRWGTTAGTGASIGVWPFKKTTIKGAPQFKGPSGAGQPLIDSRFPDTTLEFAVVSRYDEELDDAILALLDNQPKQYYFADFNKLFEDSKVKPNAILKGDQLVTWVSITVSTPDRYEEQPSYLKAAKDSDPILPAIEGTLFAHGIFFAHESLSVMPWVPWRTPLGSYHAQYLPGTPKRVWKR